MGLVSLDQLTGWSLKLMRFHRPNVVSCEVVTDKSWTPIIGAHLPLNTMAHLPDLEEALERFHEKKFKFLEDLNGDLDEP